MEKEIITHASHKHENLIANENQSYTSVVRLKFTKSSDWTLNRIQ